MQRRSSQFNKDTTYATVKKKTQENSGLLRFET